MDSDHSLGYQNGYNCDAYDEYGDEDYRDNHRRGRSDSDSIGDMDDDEERAIKRYNAKQKKQGLQAIH